MATYIEKWNSSVFRFGGHSQWWIAIGGSQACHSTGTRNEAHSTSMLFCCIVCLEVCCMRVGVCKGTSIPGLGAPGGGELFEMGVRNHSWGLRSTFPSKPDTDSISSSRWTLEKWNQANCYLCTKSKSNEKFLWKFHLSIHCICFYVLMDQDKRLLCLFNELPGTKELLGSRLGGKVTLLLPVFLSSA